MDRGHYWFGQAPERADAKGEKSPQTYRGKDANAERPGRLDRSLGEVLHLRL